MLLRSSPVKKKKKNCSICFPKISLSIKPYFYMTLFSIFLEHILEDANLAIPVFNYSFNNNHF